MNGFRQLWDDRCSEYLTAARIMGREPEIEPDSLLARDRQLGPPGRSVSPNGTCHIFRARDGFVALNLAREDDRAAVGAWLEADIDASDHAAIAGRVETKPTAWLWKRAALLHLPFAVLGEARSSLPGHRDRQDGASAKCPSGVRVLDLSVLWAGPLCGALLAEAGAEVVRWEHPARRDPTAVSTPGHYAFLNRKKEIRVEPFERSSLLDHVRGVDILITSARPHALARLGLTEESLFVGGHALLWIAITAHGWNGAEAMRVGFGDDCAVAGGLVDRADGGPAFAGDALADPLTGLEAARAALHSLARGRTGLIDAALAPTAAWYSQQLVGRCANEV